MVDAWVVAVEMAESAEAEAGIFRSGVQTGRRTWGCSAASPTLARCPGTA